jgi:hypothetical protein
MAISVPDMPAMHAIMAGLCWIRIDLDQTERRDPSPHAMIARAKGSRHAALFWHNEPPCGCRHLGTYWFIARA